MIPRNHLTHLISHFNVGLTGGGELEGVGGNFQKKSMRGRRGEYDHKDCRPLPLSLMKVYKIQLLLIKRESWEVIQNLSYINFRHENKKRNQKFSTKYYEN